MNRCEKLLELVYNGCTKECMDCDLKNKTLCKKDIAYEKLKSLFNICSITDPSTKLIINNLEENVIKTVLGEELVRAIRVLKKYIDFETEEVSSNSLTEEPYVVGIITLNTGLSSDCIRILDCVQITDDDDIKILDMLFSKNN